MVYPIADRNRMMDFFLFWIEIVRGTQVLLAQLNEVLGKSNAIMQRRLLAPIANLRNKRKSLSNILMTVVLTLMDWVRNRYPPSPRGTGYPLMLRMKLMNLYMIMKSLTKTFIKNFSGTGSKGHLVHLLAHACKKYSSVTLCIKPFQLLGR